MQTSKQEQEKDWIDRAADTYRSLDGGAKYRREDFRIAIERHLPEESPSDIGEKIEEPTLKRQFRKLSMDERSKIKKYHGKIIKVVAHGEDRIGRLDYTDLIDGRFGISHVDDKKGLCINTLAILHDISYDVYVENK